MTASSILNIRRTYHKRLFTTFVIVFLIIHSLNSQIVCTLKGKIIGRNSDTLILVKATEDWRFNQIHIPILGSTFNYRLEIPQKEAYILIFMDEFYNGMMRPTYFFPENGEINFKLNSFDDYEKNEIIGSRLTDKLIHYNRASKDLFYPKLQHLNDSMMILRNKEEYFSSEVSRLLQRSQTVTDPDSAAKIKAKLIELRNSKGLLSPMASTVEEKKLQLWKEINNWRYLYIKENVDLVSYYFMIDDIKNIKYNNVNIEDIKTCYPRFLKRFPDHLYSTLLGNLIKSFETIRVGGKYIDFNLPDINGKFYSLSDIITNKIALIDLWASWCGPCIKKSRTIIPIYEEFKNRGFTVCAVAAEIKNTDQLKERLEIEKFPWINLIDLDQKNHVWDKYGVSGSGGGTFLVDKDGTILAINPSATEIKEMLNSKLK
jgi:peroxiredoxin